VSVSIQRSAGSKFNTDRPATEKAHSANLYAARKLHIC